MDRIKLTIVILLWGSIGVFIRHIELSPIVLAFLRTFIVLPVLLIFIKISRGNLRISFNHTKPYILSGILIGLASLFYGYGYSDK